MVGSCSTSIASWAALRSAAVSPPASTAPLPPPQPPSAAVTTAAQSAPERVLCLVSAALLVESLRVGRDDLQNGRQRARGRGAADHVPVGHERERLGAAVGPADAGRRP